MFTCLIDNQSFETEKALHNHISRKLKTPLCDYYHKYHPRYDKFSGALIEFKNKEFYFSALFNSRENLVAYFNSKKWTKSDIREVISLRKSAKNLKFAPSTVEARTSILPSPMQVAHLGLNYNEICKELGLEIRFDYEPSIDIDFGRKLEIIVDTREQKPLPLKADITVSKLDFGDYTCRNHYNGVFIERKSLIDFCGTLSAGFERLQREIERAKEMNAYIIVCVESNIKNLSTIGKTPETSHVKAHPELFGVRMRELCQKYENLQFLFVDGRVQLCEIVNRIFSLKNDVKRLDLQFCYDKKLI